MIVFAYLRKIRSAKLQKAAETLASKATQVLPLDQAKEALPVLSK